MHLTLEQPLWLLLLLAVPLTWVLAWRLGMLKKAGGTGASVLRSVVGTLVVLALAGLAVLEEHNLLSVIFVVDASRSIASGDAQDAGGQAAARTFVQQAMDARPDEDLAGIITFGQDAEIERLVRDDSDAPGWTTHPEPGGTHIENALRLALASFPPDTHRRIVLLSDGIETHGRALNQATIARELHVPVDVVTLPTAHIGPDVVAESLVAPARAEALQPFDLRLQVRSPQATDGRVLLYRNDELLGELPVHLDGGLDVLTIPQTLDTAGLYRFRAVIQAQPDGEQRNNEVRTTVEVGGQPRILHLEGYSTDAEHLRNALLTGGYLVTTGSPADLPDTLEEMAPWDVIILSDVPATEMSRLQMTALEQYVTDLGKGLVMIGGDQSFGLGGYFKTRVEEVLPVSMTREAKRELPSQGIVLAIDSSGSMAGMQGVAKIDLAKDAAVAVTELLTQKDELGIIGFDSSASWVVPYGRLDDKRDVIYRIGTLRAGGGTDIYNALRSSYDGIRGGDASVKHIILLSDGIAENSDLPALAKRINDDKITLTTVAIGGDSDRYTMETLARIGGGRYYETESAETVPQIFTRETMLASRNFIVENTFVPHRVDPSEILAGIDALPPLDGYVATTLKPGATLALASGEDEPVLAHWRRGLGKSVAFTSDAKTRWARAWVEDPEAFAKFWNQTLRWVAKTGAADNLAVTTTLQGGSLTITADSMNDADYLGGAQTHAHVIHPDGRRQDLPLQQVAPGRYRAQIDAPAEGTYFVSVQQTLAGEETGRAVREVFRAYSPELAPAHTGTPVLQELASATGGALDPAPKAVWTHDPAPLTTPRSIAPWLLLAAALLWLLDVAYRRFEGFRLPRRHPKPAPVAAPMPRVQVSGRKSAAPKYTVGLGQGEPTAPEPADIDADAPPPKPADPPQFTNRLLDAKKRSRKK